MAKRAYETEEKSRPPKRVKQSNHEQPAITIEEIKFARQLQQILTFRQDTIDQLRDGLASFKAFLDKILYQSDDGDQERRLSILREFLDSQKPRDENDTARPFLAQLWQAWSFANQSSNDHLSSSICAIFALLLKTISTLIDFRDDGFLLCRTLMQHQHLRLVKRCLDAPKHKDFLISPSLRLLLELVGFDGGVFAREAYKRREETFDVRALRKNLTMTKTDLSDEDLKRKPAVRTLTIRYILAHLKYQSEGGKIDILKQRPLCGALFSHLRDDPAELILEMLRATEASVFKDNELPRSAKSALLTLQHLERVTDIATRSVISDAVTEAALNWLEQVIGIPSYGILRRSAWYPPGTTTREASSAVDEEAIDLGLDSLESWENDEKYLIRNTVLAAWIQTLRPSSNLRERRLIIKSFEAAPELVHAYFKDNALQMDPKLTNTWIGYASFIFEVIRSSVPDCLGNIASEDFAELPPQISIIMNNILPRPLTAKVLNKCLNQSSGLIPFSGTRALVLAFEKFRKVQQQFEKARDSSSEPLLWQEASTRLTDAFMAACPKMKDVINMFRKLPSDEKHLLQREAVTKLLRLFYEITPALALQENFDISNALVSALSRDSENDIQDPETRQLHGLELEHLLTIAQHGTGIRWFQKQGGLKYSPIATVLDLCARPRQGPKMRQLLAKVLYENGVLSQPKNACQASPVDALVSSVSHTQQSNIKLFIDDCLIRSTKKPVKYLDDLDALSRPQNTDDLKPSLFTAVLLEQASFVAETQAAERNEIMNWVNTFLVLLRQTTDECITLDTLIGQISAIEGWMALPTDAVSLSLSAHDKDQEDDLQHTAGTVGKLTSGQLPFPALTKESDNHPELFRWQKKDLDIAFEDGDVDALIQCLCSNYAEVRRQAQMALENLKLKLQASDIDEREQVYILIGELLETSQRHAEIDDKPLPYLVGSFAVHALHVQLDPTHLVYPKLNQYLMKGPEWRLSKLSSYWLASTSLSMPSDDDTYWKEVQWVLGWLVDGLRTGGDVEVLRRAGSFERLLEMCASPAASNALIQRKVFELIYRAALIDANTLVTRTGILTWLEVQADPIAASLRQLILSQCDGIRMSAWGGVKLS